VVNNPLVLKALAQAAIKQRILGKNPAKRLIDYGVSCGVNDPLTLRNWLTKANDLHPDLARKLLSLLPQDDLEPLGAYQPLIHLADGGMGSIWLASSADRQDLVVVKTIRSNAAEAPGAADDEGLRRFARETRITRELDHRNVVRCLDSGVSDRGTKFLVLEYVDSGDLRDLVYALGGLTEALGLAILYQVAEGLAEAHRLNLIHRDIKPANIFVASNGNAKLADFGIARSTDSMRTILTREGSLIGSPLYMSPEQIITDPTLDIRSDIYALGAVLYFCLAAKAPFGGKLQEIMHQHCTAPVPDIRRMRPEVSPSCQELITIAMTKDRTQRFQTPEELRDAIGSALKRLGMHPEPATDASTALSTLSSGTRRHMAQDISKQMINPRGKSGLAEVESSVGSTPAARAARATCTKGSTPVDPLATTALSVEISSFMVKPVTSVNLGAMETITALLMAEESLTPRPAFNAKESSTSARVLAEDPVAVASPIGKGAVATPAFPLEGDIQTALTEPWLVLTPAAGQLDDTAQPLVFLFAQPAVRMGKLREHPNDLCLRNYPVMLHKEACQRLSRQHLVLNYDAVGRQCLLEDLNAPNGTKLNGIPLPAGKTSPLRSGVDNLVELAGVVVLWLRCLPRTGGKLATPTGLTAGHIGLDSDCPFDAVVMTRQENRPELAYAQVLRRLSIGGPGAELTLTGARTSTAVELAVIGAHWLWRLAAVAGTAPTAWKPLTTTTDLDCGGRLLRAAPARHEQYG
jgi:serine/threonine protein kinase